MPLQTAQNPLLPVRFLCDGNHIDAYVIWHHNLPRICGALYVNKGKKVSSSIKSSISERIRCLSPRYVYRGMPETCAAAGCNNTRKEGVSLHRFPENQETRQKWIKEVSKTRDKWSEPSKRAVLCSLHFAKECYQTSTSIEQELGIPCKKPKLLQTAIPTLFPKPEHIQTNSMEWAFGSPSYQGPSTTSSRPAVIKRKRAQVCWTFVDSCTQKWLLNMKF